jgi:hypothetical protein
MAQRRSPAKDVTKHYADGYYISHAAITDDDASWLKDARSLTLWNVTMPADFLSCMGELTWLDVRGGSAEKLFVRHASRLEYLYVNQVRGMHDLSEVASLRNLRFLNLYGLAKLAGLPSLEELQVLSRVDLGQMRALGSFSQVLDAPNLKELTLVRKISVSPDDLRRIQQHPTLEAFDWIAEDVPDKVWVPVVEQVKLPKTRPLPPEKWFEMNR